MLSRNQRGRKRIGVLAALLLLSPAARADDLAFWGHLIVPIFRTERSEFSGDFQYRSGSPETSGRMTARAGASWRYRLRSWFQPQVSYLAIFDVNAPQGMITSHRIQAGVGYALPAAAPIRLRGTSFYEHSFINRGLPDTNVFRQRLEADVKIRKWDPWFYEDVSFGVNRGFYRSRTRAGLSWKLAGDSQFRLGYEFDAVKIAGAWVPQHTIYSQFRFGKGLAHHAGD